MRRELQGSAVLMQPLILDLNFWHRSFLTTIMVDHYPLLSLHAAKKNLSCSCSFAPSPRHQYPRCMLTVFSWFHYPMESTILIHMHYHWSTCTQCSKLRWIWQRVRCHARIFYPKLLHHMQHRLIMDDNTCMDMYGTKNPGGVYNYWM